MDELRLPQYLHCFFFFKRGGSKTALVSIFSLLQINCKFPQATRKIQMRTSFHLKRPSQVSTLYYSYPSIRMGRAGQTVDTQISCH